MAVAKPIERELEAELGGSTMTDPDAISLRQVARHPGIARLIAPQLLERLERGASVGSVRLDRIVAMLQVSNEAVRLRLGQLAANKVRSAESLGADETIIWLHAWMRVDPEAAWSFLERKAGQNPDDAREALSGLLLRLKDDIESEQEGAYLRRPKLLARMIPLLYRFFPLDRDRAHEGFFAYGTEEEIQDARSGLAGLVEKIPGAEAHDALHDLLVHPELTSLRDAYRGAIERHAAKAIEPSAWSARDVGEFARRFERTPENAGELFELVCSRLRNIKYEIEEGDFGDRGIFGRDVPEEIVQRYFAGRLRRTSHGRYTVTREEEVAEYKKPDIRVHARAENVVSVEMKPLDRGRYSLVELKDTLKTQLVGQYMRDARALHGVLLLVMVEPRRWRSPTGQSFGLEQLVEMLRVEASRLVSARPSVHGLEVVGINMSPPSRLASRAGRAKAATKRKGASRGARSGTRRTREPL